MSQALFVDGQRTHCRHMKPLEVGRHDPRQPCLCTCHDAAHQGIAWTLDRRRLMNESFYFSLAARDKRSTDIVAVLVGDGTVFDYGKALLFD